MEGGRPDLGLAVHGGAVVHVWDSALRGPRDPKDGHNVVIHELTHKIDFIDGEVDGTPMLEKRSARTCRVTVFPVPVAPVISPWRFASAGRIERSSPDAVRATTRGSGMRAF
jgi:hypothetical protein